MIDTHAHLDGPEYAEALEEVILRAKKNGVRGIMIPGLCHKDTPHLLDICRTHAGFLFPMIGLHPENIQDEDYHQALTALERILQDSLQATDTPSDSATPIIGIGEVGLDFYWDDTHKKEQMEVFEQQIQWAEKYHLPLMIHARNAHHELIEMMERHRSSQLSGVFHCFTGTAQEAAALLSFPNFMLGIGGVLTFKKSTLREVVKEAIPLTRIVLETDAPYMTPVPHRGQRNESAYVRLVAEMLAEIYEIEINQIVHQTTENALKVFPKATFFNKNQKFPPNYFN
ncbi:MAG: TatD family hydrolase [Bacteroidaceae bacterium]|nr:TatD family hydrolase [Bacteroidaceae bacterium]